MDYITRELERKFLHMNDFFKAILVTGARQVGKTTMLKHLCEGQNRTYVTLDNMMARTLAQNDPALFFQTYKPPILIDEVQYAPSLFSEIKILCDQSEQTGLFWLTGSQQYKVMKNVRETLAGRVGILTLYGLSQREKKGVLLSDTLDFSLPCLQERQRILEKNDIHTVFDHIWRGGYPQPYRADSEQRQEYFNSYVDTYLMRDITDGLRIEEGHWEGDTVVGKRAGKEAVVLSLLEKKTQTYLAFRIPAKTSEAVMGAMNALHNEYGDHFSEVFKTITVDNGSEFADFAQVAAWGSQIYFAHPYTSWERPQNERHNGLFRAFVPKGVSIEQYSDEDILTAADELNGRPRRKLGYRTPEELFEAFLDSVFVA